MTACSSGRPWIEVEQFLQLKPTFQAGGLKAQFGDEFGECLQLPRIGIGMHAPQKRNAGRVQRVGHRFVGREHELFDDLMAFGVLDDVRPGDTAMLIQIDFHLLHRQFQRAALESPPAQHHRQLVHSRQQAHALLVSVCCARLRDRPDIHRLLRT